MRYIGVIIAIFLFSSCLKEKDAQVVEESKSVSVRFDVVNSLNDDINYLQFLLVQNEKVVKAVYQEKSFKDFGICYMDVMSDPSIAAYCVGTTKKISKIEEINNIVNIDSINSIPINTFIGMENIVFNGNHSPISVSINLTRCNRPIFISLVNDLPDNADMLMVKYRTLRALGNNKHYVDVIREYKVSNELKQQRMIELNSPANLNVAFNPDIIEYTEFIDIEIMCFDTNGNIIAAKAVNRYVLSGCAVVVGQLFDEFDLEVACNTAISELRSN